MHWRTEATVVPGPIYKHIQLLSCHFLGGARGSALDEEVVDKTVLQLSCHFLTEPKSEKSRARLPLTPTYLGTEKPTTATKPHPRFIERMSGDRSKEEAQIVSQKQLQEEDDEPDEWDKRIFSTGCADENMKMTDCYYETKDWRKCKDESAYARAATTSTSSNNSSSSNNNSSSASTPKPTYSTYKNTNTPFAESQINPVASPPYSRPQDMGAIPEASTTNGGGSSETPFANNGIDWTSSYHGLSTVPFDSEIAALLMKPIPFEDVEIKPDGIIYLPEIKYRRILNQAFGPGGWGMAPRSELGVGERVVTREYALLVHGRFIAQARGECQYFADDGIATAGEGCKSNALMRCCKDIGIASELWDPRYIREFKKKYAQEIWVEHVVTKKKRQTWVRKGDDPQYPYKKC
ncbi:hypothetical protein VM1G_05412 [Cytospora mali]|uniref:Mitochondrial genome maintenance protein MGM101 n=1 Tax=Cytospora mali TaxID=578113 RepID=A0A194VYX7_CYTMA|nr:hypothetical protein VM1G_05412 [Valsa mali]